MKLTKIACGILKVTAVASVSLALSNVAFAGHKTKSHCKTGCKTEKAVSVNVIDYKQEAFSENMWMSHWYVGGNIGISQTHDNPTTTGNVHNVGPGWSVDGGYQFTPVWGLETGYTQYHDSHDDLTGVNIAYTEHHSAYLAATAQYGLPFCQHLSALGKLGAGYNYARKDTPTGPTATARSVSVYGGLGFAYNMTRNVDLIGQWARSWGNNLTGSTDLYSVGLKVALI